MFQGWSDGAVRGYITMLEERLASKRPSIVCYDQKLIEAKQELQVREHRSRLAQAVTGSSAGG